MHQALYTMETVPAWYRTIVEAAIRAVLKYSRYIDVQVCIVRGGGVREKREVLGIAYWPRHWGLTRDASSSQGNRHKNECGFSVTAGNVK